MNALLRVLLVERREEIICMILRQLKYLLKNEIIVVTMIKWLGDAAPAEGDMLGPADFARIKRILELGAVVLQVEFRTDSGNIVITTTRKVEIAMQVAVDMSTINLAGIAGILHGKMGIPDTEGLIPVLVKFHPETVLCTISNDEHTRASAIHRGCHIGTDRNGFAPVIVQEFEKCKAPERPVAAQPQA